MPNVLISVENLGYTFAPDKPPAYTGVNFSLSSGELMCLAGVNGSGKSTLLRTLAGLYLPSSGTIHVHGAPLNLNKENSPLRHISALVVQEANMQILGSTVAEDIELTIKAETQINTKERGIVRPAKSQPDEFHHNKSRPEKWQFGKSSEAKTRENLEEKAHTILSFLNLEHKLNWPVQTLSYGEKRKLCLATAFLRDPALFLLDEPFSGLDYPACLEVLAYIKLLLARGTAIIMSTHDTDLIFDQTDKFLFLSPQKTPFYGTRLDAPRQYAAFNLKPLQNSGGK